MIRHARGLLTVALLVALALLAGRWMSTRGDADALFAAHARLRGLALLSQVRERPPAGLVFGDSLVEATAIDTLCGETALAAGAWGARLDDIVAIAPEIVDAARPKRIVVAIGINDAVRGRTTDPTTFAGRYRDLIEPWRAAGIDIRLATLAPVVRGRDLGDRNFDPDHAERLNEAVRELARSLDLTLVPFERMPRAADGGLDPTLSEDGVHFTPEGRKAWKTILEEAACAPRPAP